MARTWSPNISAHSFQSHRNNIRRAHQSTLRSRPRRRHDALVAPDSPDQSSNSDDESWDEEETLVSMYLRHDYALQSIRHPTERDTSALVDGIGATWARQREQLKEDMIQVVLPAIKKSKYTKNILDEEVDSSTIEGIKVFGDACMKMEGLCIKESKTVKQEYDRSEANLRQLYQQLEDAYARKQAHWDAYSDKFEDLCTHAIQDLLIAPTHLEETIASIEKKSKQLHKK